MDNCFRYIGFPDDFEFTKGKNTLVKGNAVSTGEDARQLGEGFMKEAVNNSYQFPKVAGNNSFQHFSEGQIAEIAQMFNAMNMSKSTSTAEISANAIAGTILKYSGTCFSVFKSTNWIIDSGASEHMCFDASSFSSITPLQFPLNISLPNSFKVTVTHIGSVSILPNLTLTNVLYVPVFRYNLLSVHRLSDQIKWNVLFTSGHCLLQDLLMKRVVAFGELREGLYLLEPAIPKSSLSVVNPKGRNSISTPVIANAIPDVSLWHIRLGHLPLSALILGVLIRMLPTMDTNTSLLLWMIIVEELGHIC